MSLRYLKRQLQAARRSESMGELETAAAVQPAFDDAIPPPEPRLSPRDEAVYLLHAGAEVEHMLMAQYLFAAYSLDESGAPGEAERELVRQWRTDLSSIAKEEMGHLLTLQNVLLLIGGPLHFDREDYPFDSEVYPFRFELEAVSEKSLGKYVLAEMPDRSKLDSEQENTVREIERLLEGSFRVNSVGRLYKRLLEVFAGLRESDFVSGIEEYQAKTSDWTADSGSLPRRGNLSVQIDTALNGPQAIEALRRIAEQGEGMLPGAEENAHFDHFLKLYRDFRDRGSWRATYRVPDGPSASQIPDPDTRRWAHLFDLRYRLLLSLLSHSMRTPGPTTENGSPTQRGSLVNWTFYEMRHLKLLADVLVTLPHGSAANVVAAAPFDMPYTLALPDREVDRWRAHLEITTATATLIEEIDPNGLTGQQRRALETLRETTTRQAAALRGYASQQPLPPATGYERVVRIFDEAMRGFAVPTGPGFPHPNFWREGGVPSGRLLTEQEFLDRDKDLQLYPGQRIVTPGNPDVSVLVRALERPAGSMPRGRPMLERDELQVVRAWIASLPADGPGGPGGPATPGGPQPGSRYQRVLDILDNAVSNQDIGAHGRFWKEKTRDEFVALRVIGQQLLIVGDGNGSNLVKALRGENPFGSDIGTPSAFFRRMPAGLDPVADADIALVRQWIDDGCPEGERQDGGAVDLNGGGPLDGTAVNAYWRDFDNWALFQAEPPVENAVGEFFGIVGDWITFATNPASEPAWAAAIAQPAARDAISLLASRQAETIRQHFGDPVQFLTLLDAYERFGNDTLPDDPERPERLRHRMDGAQMWFNWSAFGDACLRLGFEPQLWQAHLRAILLGLLNDGVIRGRFNVDGFAATEAGKQAMRDHVRNLADNALQAELRTRYAQSGFAG